MYRKIEDFVNDWKAEAEFTVKIFSNIPDEIKAKKMNEKVRSLDRLAWHITQTLTEMPFRAGIVEKDYLDMKSIPSSFHEIIETYKKHSDQLVSLLKEKWKDADLMEVIEVYGQKWQRTKILSVLINHQIHHRAQMTIIMRLLDLKVPGIYGPAKEEWTNYGMEPQE
ncbi:DinB family protein [Calditrichota bacterium]